MLATYIVAVNILPETYCNLLVLCYAARLCYTLLFV